MIAHDSTQKITPEHLARKAIVYLRQSSLQQVKKNKESQHLQYALADRARALGFGTVEVIDCDLGASAGFAARSGRAVASSSYWRASRSAKSVSCSAASSRDSAARTRTGVT